MTTQVDRDALTLLGRVTAGVISRKKYPTSVLIKPLNRLLTLGFVGVDGDGIFITPKGKEFVDKQNPYPKKERQ